MGKTHQETKKEIYNLCGQDWTHEEVLGIARMGRLHNKDIDHEFYDVLEGPWQCIQVTLHTDRSGVDVESPHEEDADDMPATFVPWDLALGLAIIECGEDFGGADAVSGFLESAAWSKVVFA